MIAIQVFLIPALAKHPENSKYIYPEEYDIVYVRKDDENDQLKPLDYATKDDATKALYKKRPLRVTYSRYKYKHNDIETFLCHSDYDKVCCISRILPFALDYSLLHRCTAAVCVATGTEQWAVCSCVKKNSRNASC